MRLANCSKSEQHTIMTQEFQRVCMAKGFSTELYTPIVTATLKQMIMGFQFVGNGVDDLSTGYQPFLVSYAGNVNNLLLMEAASVGNQLGQGDQSATTLTDYRTLRDREKVKFPRDTTEVCITLGRYAVLCQALFQGTGPLNPWVESIWKFVAALQNAAPFITDRYREVANVYFVSIVRAVQVAAHEYLHSVALNVSNDHTGVEPPELSTLVTEVSQVRHISVLEQLGTHPG